MSNTVITNYTDLNGPSSKADGSVVVIVNKDGSLSVDQNLLGTLMGTDGSQASGISVVRVGHEGKPDDATDSESEDDKIPHVTLTVDSYYDEPNSILKYDSGAEMLQSLKIETRENSLVGFQNDHCYTPLTSPSQSLPQRSDSFYDEPVIEISHTPPPKPIPSSKKITILEQQIIPKGRKILINPTDSPVILKGSDVLKKTLPGLSKARSIKESDKFETASKSDDNVESSSISSSGDSIPDRDSDSDYKDTKDRAGTVKVKKCKLKPRILKPHPSKAKLDPKITSRLKSNKNLLRKEVKEKIQLKSLLEKRKSDVIQPKEVVQSPDTVSDILSADQSKTLKQTPKSIKKEKKTPAHVTALLSDMTSLFSTPDVIRRVSTENKTPLKDYTKKPSDVLKLTKPEGKPTENKPNIIKKELKQSKIVNPAEKVTKSYDPIPQIDDVSLAEILQDTTGITSTIKTQPTISTPTTLISPGLAGPLSPTLDLLAGLQPEDEGLSEDLLMHVAQLVESSENLQEVIDKQVLGKVDTVAKPVALTPFQQAATNNLYQQTPVKSVKTVPPARKEAIEIVRKDGRVITLPPIEAPATRASKRKSQMETPTSNSYIISTPTPVVTPVVVPEVLTPEPQMLPVSKQYANKKVPKKLESLLQAPVLEKLSAESQESWNSEDDPNRLWCICKQPHNNRFMICCDSCEDWFHGKCVNITKAMGQQMEEQGIEWRCPNCVKKTKPTTAKGPKISTAPKNPDINAASPSTSLLSKPGMSKTGCIVCKKSARASSIYCSDACILKHAQDSLGSTGTPTKTSGDQGKVSDKQKTDSRVIVYERKSGRLLAGPNAPTAENLKAWLQKNPTFEVVRPGTLSTIRPNIAKKSTDEPSKIQTTLNFERIPKKTAGPPNIIKSNQPEPKPSTSRVISTPLRVEAKNTSQPTTPVTPKSQYSIFDTPKASTSSAKCEPKKVARRPQSSYDKTPSVSPAASRRKDSIRERRMDSIDPIRDNVRKILQEQMSLRMSENTGPKFSEEELKQFAFDTEYELHELFRDVGMKYKAKYRSLMFNIKDRKNLSLWQKICDRTITPKQLVRLSPEDLASQELAQWRDKEAKYQLELIKKSELDLLAASKTYVLKTHKGEEVMETKKSISTELDPNVPMEDLVSALNDSTAANEPSKEAESVMSDDKKYGSSIKKDKDDNGSKKSSRGSRRDSEGRKSKTSRRKSDLKEKESCSTRRSDRKTNRARSRSRSKVNKSESDRSRRRSRSRGKLRKRSKSREHSRSLSQEKDKSPSREQSKRQSQADESSRRPSTRSKLRSTSDEKGKLRSRSQENITKNKNDSTDSDTIERPKSAMMKEVHPEYDPHEPMITSAFSEEDLRKSREDVFEDEYKGEIGEVEYDPTQVFSINTNVALPVPTGIENKEKASEAESDQEPTSTVDNSAVTVWNGCINMVDVARFYVAAHEVSGAASDLEEDLSAELDIVGRINPDTVWDYISKMKRASNKDIIILRLQAANDEEKMQYIALYSYLSSRNRLGVVKVSNTTTVKDFYIVPLPANTALPGVLLPLDGPGLGEVKTHLLLAIVIRQRKKRSASHIPKDIVPAKVSRESRKRSYTPPTSPRRRQLPLPLYTSPALSTSVKDKIAASLAAADDDEPYSPGSSSSGGSVTPIGNPPSESKLKSKMEELNRQIEEQKQQIRKMTQADSSIGGEDEAYSPSRPMTPPTVVPLSDISLPSNLQEILATIKQRSETSAVDVDMRTLPPP